MYTINDQRPISNTAGHDIPHITAGLLKKYEHCGMKSVKFNNSHEYNETKKNYSRNDQH